MLAIRFIGRLTKYLSKDHLKMMVNAFVTLCFDYCNNLYCGLPKREIDKLQRVQNCAACLVLGTRKSDHITPVMKDLHWLPIGACIDFKILLLRFKILKDLAPYYLPPLLLKYQLSRVLCSSNRLLLQVPSVNTVA